MNQFLNAAGRRAALAVATLMLASTAVAGTPTGEPALAIRPLAKDVQWGPCPPIFAKGCEIAVLHGNPANPNADIWLRVPPGFFLPPHTHSSNERMVLSTGELEVRYENQQKVVLAKWLIASGDVLILDEPTRGVDVGDKAELQSWINQRASEGGAVLLISSELPELLTLASRILVLREGRLCGEIPREHATQDGLLRLMAGLD
jgi:hypothetical protein